MKRNVFDHFLYIILPNRAYRKSAGIPHIAWEADRTLCPQHDLRLKMKKPQKPSPLAAAASPLFLFSKDLFLYDVPMSDSAVSRVISFSDVLFHRRLSFCRDSHSHRSVWTIYQNVRASPERTSDQPRSRSYVQQSCAAAYVV